MMKTILSALFCILIGSTFSSCNKEWGHTVYGQIIDADTKQPTNNTKFVFWENIEASSFPVRKRMSRDYKFTTDGEGHFAVKYTSELNNTTDITYLMSSAPFETGDTTKSLWSKYIKKRDLVINVGVIEVKKQ